MPYKFDGIGILKMTPDWNGFLDYFHSKQHFIGRGAQFEAWFVWRDWWWRGLLLYNIAVQTVWFAALLTQQTKREGFEWMHLQRTRHDLFCIKPTTVIWSECFRREVKYVCQAPWSEWWMSMSHCIKCLSEHAEHPLLLQILFVECVLVGSEGMTEQNLIRIDSQRSNATTCLFVSVLSSICYGLSRRASLFFPISSQHRDKYGKINNGKSLFFWCSEISRQTHGVLLYSSY